MTELLLRETRLALTKLAREQGVSIPTAWRWSQSGTRGHVLETFTLGGRKYTTREAFARWVARINGEKVVGAATPRQREAAIDRAEAAAAELGV